MTNTVNTKSSGAKPVVLVVCDGWGIGRDEAGNAILAANTPTMDRLMATYPNTTLRCSGEDVGLPDGQMGNSEVGHLNIGAGFVVYQSLTRINRAIHEGSFQRNTTLIEAMRHVVASSGRLHLLGLVSDGGVHSHVNHLEAILAMAGECGLSGSDVCVHAITDGRDTAPDSGLGFIQRLSATVERLGVGKITTVLGRYYAMDRDQRWERTQAAFDAIVHGRGHQVETAIAAIEASYAGGITDEFIVPCVMSDAAKLGARGIQAGDAILWFNFRADRARQLTHALTLETFDQFDRGSDLVPVPVTTLTRYEHDLPLAVAFEDVTVTHPLAAVVSEAGLNQFHSAETEKYPHVTYFLNGGREAPFPREQRELIPSPKVATYDLQPEMSAVAVTNAVVAAIASGEQAFVVVNFANCDMVGHTGDLAAVIAAIECVDQCVNRVITATLVAGGSAVVTADHGNAEAMIDPVTGGPLTAHTTNPVPAILVTPEDHPYRHRALRADALLSALAPTVLDLMRLDAPAEMTERSLVTQA